MIKVKHIRQKKVEGYTQYEIITDEGKDIEVTYKNGFIEILKVNTGVVLNTIEIDSPNDNIMYIRQFAGLPELKNIFDFSVTTILGDYI